MQEMVFSVEKLSLLFELSRGFNALIDLEALLPAVISKTKEILQAENCALLLLDIERQEMFFPVISDISPAIEARFTALRFPADRGVAGWVIQHGKSALVPDVARDERFYAAVDQGPISVHVQDLVALEPNDAEFREAEEWVVQQDEAPEFSQFVSEVVAHVRERRADR